MEKRRKKIWQWMWTGVGLLVLVTGCARTLYPITTGSYRSLPQEGTRVIVWSNHQDALIAVAKWLQDRGVLIWDPASVQQMLTERRRASGPKTGDQREKELVLEVAKAVGADGVVFAEISGVKPYAASISIEGVNKNGEDEWQAAAWFPNSSLGVEDAMMDLLACQALATVWGFRPAGYHEIASSAMCNLIRTGPHRHPSAPSQQLG